jgi:nicotinate-nucleotide adenylyltransferase
LTPARLRVGVFGGAFDPPHRAHVALAAAAVAQLPLDRLIVLPTGQAYHKQRELTAGEHRLAMATLAFSAVPGAIVDDRELKRSGPTYTVDTLRELAAEQPQAELHLLMGEDQAGSFSSWREWQAIAALAVLCVAERADSARHPRPSRHPRGGGDPELPVSGLDRLLALPGVRVRTLSLPLMPESATDIRARLTAGQDITELVDPQVASYIDRHCLYPST